METAPNANALAYLALLLVVPATIAAFAYLKPTRAVLAVLLGSLLFLPELVCFDAPLVPPLNKQSLPALCMLCAVLVTAGSRVRAARPGRGIDGLMLLAMAAIVGTVLTNRDPLNYGPTQVVGHKMTDVLSEVIRMLLGPIIPFFLGRTLFRSSEDARDLLRALVLAGLVYAPFIAIELRFSPQFHNWIYGFGQHAWEQVIRGGGWRPMVFMAHGLALTLFVCASSLAAFSLGKAGLAVWGLPARACGGFLFVLLALMNSLGAFIYAVVTAPLVWFLKAKTILRVAVVLACIVAAYPVMRATETFPRKEIVDFAAQASQDRAASLDFRFENEEMLLTKALERPWFGWGGFARAHVYDERGINISVVDGAWIGLVSSYGIVGFVARFGLLLIPIFMARRTMKRLSGSDQALLSGISLITIVYVVDLLPNGMFNELPMFLAGTVTGLAQGMAVQPARRIDPALVLKLLEVLRMRNAPRVRELPR